MPKLKDHLFRVPIPCRRAQVNSEYAEDLVRNELRLCQCVAVVPGTAKRMREAACDHGSSLLLPSFGPPCPPGQPLCCCAGSCCLTCVTAAPHRVPSLTGANAAQAKAIHVAKKDWQQELLAAAALAGRRTCVTAVCFAALRIACLIFTPPPLPIHRLPHLKIAQRQASQPLATEPERSSLTSSLALPTIDASTPEAGVCHLPRRRAPPQALALVPLVCRTSPACRLLTSRPSVCVCVCVERERARWKEAE